MTTATAIISAAAALVAVLISLTTLSPRARRVKRLAEHVAIYKDLPEGDLRDEYTATVRRAMQRVQADEPDRSVFDLAFAFCARGVLISASVVLVANVGRVVAGEETLFESTEALVLGVLNGVVVTGTIVFGFSVAALVVTVVWELVASGKRRRAARADERRTPEAGPSA